MKRLIFVNNMDTQVKTLDELVKELTPHSRAEVRDFAEFLHSKRKGRSIGKFSQKWAGALNDFREEYTSLELQRKSLDWRG